MGSCNHVSYYCMVVPLGEKVKWELRNDASCCFQLIQEAVNNMDPYTWTHQC